MILVLWWRWQDLNLRPWDYDAPAPPQIIEKSGAFFKVRKIREKDLGDKISLIN